MGDSKKLDADAQPAFAARGIDFSGPGGGQKLAFYNQMEAIYHDARPLMMSTAAGQLPMENIFLEDQQDRLSKQEQDALVANLIYAISMLHCSGMAKESIMGVAIFSLDRSEAADRYLEEVDGGAEPTGVHNRKSAN